MMSGLLIRSPFIDWILAGSKTWEIRGSSTAKRGRIGLIKSGTGTVVGVVDLIDVVGPLTPSEFLKNAEKLGVKQSELSTRLPYEQTFAWVLRNAKRLSKPVFYHHRPGCVIWVNLSETIERNIIGKLGR